MTIESYDLDVCLVMNAVSNCPKGTPAKPAPPQNHTVPIPPALSASTGASAVAVVPISPVASGTPAAPFSKSMAVTSTIPPGARSTSPASSTVQPYGCSMADATSLSANASGPSSVATDPAVISPGGHSIATTGSRCCDSGRAIYTDPVSGQTLCSCQYDMLSYQRLAAAGSLMAGPIGVYPESMSAYLSGISADQPPFYNPAGLDLKENLVGSGAPWPYPSVYHPYDTAFAGYPFSSYGIELNNSRRKNATRETTSTLKAWLNEHKKNPYPTKGEKIMLAIITKMTLTQVSTWFANARRRLKKENKMTWEPRNRVDDDDANVDDEEIKSTDDNDLLDTKDSGLGSSGDKDRSGRMGNLMDDRPGEGNNSEWSGSRPGSPNGSPDFFDRPSGVSGSGNALFHPAALHHNFRPAAGSPPDITSYHQQQQILHHHQQTQQQIIHATVGNTAARLSVKPRIWSLADMAKDGKDSPQKENPLGHELPSSHDTLYVHAVQHPSPGKIMPPIAARIPNYSPYMRPELYRSFYGTSTAAHMTVQTQEFLEHQRTFGASLAVNNSLSMNPLLWKAAVSSCGGTPLTPLSLTTNNQQQHHLAPPPGISPSASSTSSSVGCDVVQTIPTSGTLQHQIAQISGHSTSSSASSNSGNLSPGINVTSFNAKP